MDAVHWNESMGAYMDYGANSEDGILVKAVRPFTTTLPRSHHSTVNSKLQVQSNHPCPTIYTPLPPVTLAWLTPSVFKRCDVCAGAAAVHRPR